MPASPEIRALERWRILGPLTSSLGKAGMRRHPIWLTSPNHRPTPWLSEDDARDCSNRLLYASLRAPMKPCKRGLVEMGPLLPLVEAFANARYRSQHHKFNSGHCDNRRYRQRRIPWCRGRENNIVKHQRECSDCEWHADIHEAGPAKHGNLPAAFASVFDFNPGVFLGEDRARTGAVGCSTTIRASKPRQSRYLE
jgi:hypothetical protein